MQSSDNKTNSFTWQWRGKTFSMPVTGWDVLKWAQAIDEEGYPREGVAWALLQRAAWLNTIGIKTTLGRLVQEYAQPVNPDWFPSGEKHQAELARLKRLGDFNGYKREELAAKRRVLKAKQGWGDIESETKNIVLGILSNSLASPVVGAVHYWASRGPDFAANQAAKPGLILLDKGYGFGAGRNVFFAAKGSEAFGDIKAIIRSKLIPGVDPLAMSPGKVALIGATILAGIFALRYRGNHGH